MITKSTETITPELAKAYLSKSNGNRHINPNKVDLYAKQMRAGLWRLTSQGIAISDNDILMNGHHRLHAVIAAGCQIQMTVDRGDKLENLPFYDIGQGRSFRDVLDFSKVKYSTRIATLVFKCLRYEANPKTMGRNSGSFCMDERIQFLNTHPEIEICVKLSGKYSDRLRSIVNESIVMFTFWVFYRKDNDATIDFFEKLSTGVGLPDGSPILALRKKLVDLKAGKRAASEIEKVGLVFKTWNYYREGRTVKLLKFAELGQNKEDLPEII